MVVFDGQPVGAQAAHEIVRLGVAMVPEGRRLFPSLSVEENLLARRLLRPHRAVDPRTGL